MASINARRNKDGQIVSYTIRVYRGCDNSGKHLKPYSMTWKPPAELTERQIEKELTKQAARFEEECKSGCVANPTMKMGDFCTEYLEIIRSTLSPATVAFYQREIERHIVPALGHLRLRDITPAHVQKYIQQLAALPKTDRSGKATSDYENISPSTVRRYLTVLQSIFKQAVKLGLISDSPAKTERLTIPKVLQPKIEIFSKAEAAAMLAALESEPLQFQTLIQLAIFTGARRGELVALKFSDVDFENKKITIERSAIKLKGHKTGTKPPKDYETRTVSINDSCLELLRLLRAEKYEIAKRIGDKWRGGNWIFTTWDGSIMNPQTPTKQFEKFLQRNGLRHRKFHSLRHTSATLLLYGGINIKQVQSRLGHGDIETTNKYLHVLEETDVEAANVLGSMLLPKSREQQEKIS